MYYKIFWTNKAFKTAENIIKYLREEWTEKEVNNFLNEIDSIISTIESNPKLFIASSKRPNVHLALIYKRTYLVYQIRPHKKQIALLLFWNPKQNPKKLKY
jgi:plasmid stabilization system protein ParE